MSRRAGLRAAPLILALLGACSEGDRGPVTDTASPYTARSRVPERAPAPARPPPPPVTPGRDIAIRMRKRGSDEEIEDYITIRLIDAKREDGAVRLTHIVGWSENEERERRFAVGSITYINAAGEEIEGRAAIMYWLRCQAGIATEADHLEAGLAASDAEAAMDGELLARRLRVPAWIRYTDGDGIGTERQITITAVAGFLEPDGPEAHALYAYCHMRRAPRSFLVERISAIADQRDELAQMGADDVDSWLLTHLKRRRVGKDRGSAHS